MSVHDVAGGRFEDVHPLRLAAIVAAVALTASYLSVLFHVVTVVGGVAPFVGVVAGAVVLATVFGRMLDRRQALVTGAVLLAVGMAGYLVAIPAAYRALMTTGRVVSDTIALLTGFSVMQMTQVGTWAIAVAPGPVFLTWYFVLRREYGWATAVGGLTLGFFVLTGDTDTVVTLLGVLAGASMLAFGTMERSGAGRDQIELLAVTFAVMILASATVSAVPGGERSPIVPEGTTAVQGDIVSTDERISLTGSVRLSPKVQFVVEANDPAYWRTSVYDRFTGSGWVRTGETAPYEGGPTAPTPGDRRMVIQTYTAKRTLNVMPAVGVPVRMTGSTEARMTELGGFEPAQTLEAGDSYFVESQAPEPTAEELQAAGTDYPDRIETRYLQLPNNTPDRVERLAANVTENADTPYEAAVQTERWLETNKDYSLNIQRPKGDAVDAFLFEMDSGYCVYYASSMVVMLRSQGIPARYVVGYTPGQRVDAGKWVVRGVDSHAWVEVYFPDVGWVKFDPTPAGPRTSVERGRVDQAREEGVEGVDAAGSETGPWTPTLEQGENANAADVGPEAAAFSDGRPTGYGGVLEQEAATANGTVVQAQPEQPGDTGVPTIPSTKTLAVWGVLAAGFVAGVRRTGAFSRAYREVWLHWHPDGPPDARLEAAYDRVEYVLARTHRERRADETIREYLDAVGADGRARRVAHRYEQARHAGRAPPEAADEAEAVAAEIVRERRRRLPKTRFPTMFNR